MKRTVRVIKHHGFSMNQFRKKSFLLAVSAASDIQKGCTSNQNVQNIVGYLSHFTNFVAKLGKRDKYTSLRLYFLVDNNHKGEPDEYNRKILPSLLLFKKQHIFHLPSPLNARNDLTFVTPERNILLIDIPVTCFQLLQQFAFGHFAVTF